MKKWLLLAFIFPFALSPSVGRAGPIADIGLQFMGLTTTIVGDSANNFVHLAASNGDIGQSFSGNAQSSFGVGAAVIGYGPYLSHSDATSAAWDARFKINQPDLTADIILSFTDGGFAYSTGYAFANEHTSVSLSLNGVSQLSDNQGASCNTYLLTCDNPSGNHGSVDIILQHLLVGEIIDINGMLSSNASASAGPLCFVNTFCAGIGGGTSTATFSIAAVPEPATLCLVGLCLAGIGFARRRKVA